MKANKLKIRIKQIVHTLHQGYNRLPFIIRIGIISFAFAIIIAGIGWLGYSIISYSPTVNHISIPSKVTGVTTFQQSYHLDEVTLPTRYTNPLNGERMTAVQWDKLQSQPPIAVMIENHPLARPQSGLSQANIVYESLVEGGITRYMAICWGKDVDELGPIRSARKYFVDWIAPIQPLYMHIGYAVSSDPNVNVTNELYKYNIHSLNIDGTFWRITTRLAPHNAYSSTELVLKKAGELNWTEYNHNISAWEFNDTNVKTDTQKQAINVYFYTGLSNGGMYDVKWEYDSQSNTYVRYLAGKKHIDQNTQAPIQAGVVIIQECTINPAYDDLGHLVIQTTGSGKAYIIQGGQVTEGTWKKPSVAERTQFCDANGNQVKLNRGLIWIEIVSPTMSKITID